MLKIRMVLISLMMPSEEDIVVSHLLIRQRGPICVLINHPFMRLGSKSVGGRTPSGDSNRTHVRGRFGGV